MVTQTSLEALDAARAEVKLAGEQASADQLRNYLRLVRIRREEEMEMEGDTEAEPDKKTISTLRLFKITSPTTPRSATSAPASPAPSPSQAPG